jgi:hypothetical protein
MIASGGGREASLRPAELDLIGTVGVELELCLRCHCRPSLTSWYARALNLCPRLGDCFRKEIITAGGGPLVIDYRKKSISNPELVAL